MVESYLDLPEKAALILLSLCFIAAIVGKPVAKGLIAVGMGLFVATIGTGEDFYPRLTGNVLELSGGFPIACVILGSLVIGEVFAALFAMHGEMATTGKLVRHKVTGDNSLPLAEKKRLLRFILPSAFIGTSIGARPGIGSTLAATLGYTAAKRRHEARHPDDDDKIRDRCAARCCRNRGRQFSRIGANLIPVLSLGIPGNAAAVFLILAMDSINGLNPSPGVQAAVERHQPGNGDGLRAVHAHGPCQHPELDRRASCHAADGQYGPYSKTDAVPVGAAAYHGRCLCSGHQHAGRHLAGDVRHSRLRHAALRPADPAIRHRLYSAKPLERTMREGFSATGGDPLFLFSSPICVVLMAGCAIVLSISPERQPHDTTKYPVHHRRPAPRRLSRHRGPQDQDAASRPAGCRGTRFANAITPCVICQPARASILTGQLPRTHGVHDNGIDLPLRPVTGGSPDHWQQRAMIPPISARRISRPTTPTSRPARRNV